VFGVQWLSTLGSIKWNFKSLKMELYLNGRNYVLRGLKDGKVQALPPDRLPKALLTTAHSCMLQLVPHAIVAVAP